MNMAYKYKEKIGISAPEAKIPTEGNGFAADQPQ